MSAAIPFELLENFYLSLQIQNIVLLMVCSTDETKVDMARRFSERGIAASFAMESLVEHPSQRRGAVLDISCDTSSSLLMQLSLDRAFGLHTEWLLLDSINKSSVDYGTMKHILNDLDILPGSSVTLAQISQTTKTVDFYEVYRIAMWTEMKYNHLSRQEIGVFLPFQISDKRLDFEGVTLRSASAVLYKNIFPGFGSLSIAEADIYAQMSYHLVTNMAQQLNFSFTLLLLDMYGYKKNDSFTGLMGYFQRNELDFATAGIMMRIDRMEILDFAGNVIKISSPLIFRQPALSAVSNIYVLPFTMTVWTAFIALSVLTALTLIVDLMMSIKVLKSVKAKEIPPGEIVMAIIGHLSEQGALLELKTVSGELTLLIFSIFAFFMSISYAAKIVALLQSTTDTIRSLPQLIDGPLTVAIQDLEYNKIYFQESQNKDVMKLYQKKTLPQGENAYMDPVRGIERVRSGLYAYKVETNWAYKVIAETFHEREKCGLSEMAVFMLPMLSLGVPKKSGLREHFGRSMCWQRENGLYTRVKDRLFTRKPSCDSKGVGYSSVHLSDFQPPIMAFLIGLSLAVMILIIEIIIKMKYYNKKTASKKIVFYK